ETWSPLMWRIFFDPLLSKLNKMEETKYTLSAYDNIGLENNEESRIYKSINSIAFMDDTTLISKNKDDLEKLIEKVESFLQMNEIKANIKKYELLKSMLKKKNSRRVLR